MYTVVVGVVGVVGMAHCMTTTRPCLLRYYTIMMTMMMTLNKERVKY
jgi:hypothetical protein